MPATSTWRRVPICRTYLGLFDGPHATPKPSDEGPVFLGIGNITEDGHLDLTSVRHIAEEDFAKWTRRVEPKAGDIVFTYEATLNRYAVIPPGFRGCLGRRLALIRPNPEVIDTRFLHFYFFGADWRSTIARNTLSGATVERVPLTRFPDFPVNLPPLSVQRRIASILSAYDDLIENNTRRIAILEEMARRIYEEWFVRFRFPGHEGVRMVDHELGAVPEGWQYIRLEEACSRITDGSHFSPSSTPTGMAMASVKDMGDWSLDLNTCRRISKEDYDALVRNGCKPEVGDILVAKDGNTNLKYMFVFDDPAEVVLLSSVAILRPNGLIAPNQLATYLRLPYVKQRLRGYVSGAAIPRVILKDFRQFMVLLAPKDIQDAWASICDPMLSLCRSLVRKNTNLRTTRDLLLPKLISGELDVSKMPEPEEVAA